jgi:hypothetical protein
MFKYIKTNDLIKAPWNYKVEDSFLKTKLTNNVNKNGFIENIIVREMDDGKFEVVNGNHRLDVAIDLGIDKVFSFNLGKVSLAKAKRVALETNELRYNVDKKILANIIGSITEEVSIDELKSTLPFDDNEIDALLDSLDDIENLDEILSNGDELEKQTEKKSNSKNPKEKIDKIKTENINDEFDPDDSYLPSNIVSFELSVSSDNHEMFVRMLELICENKGVDFYYNQLDHTNAVKLLIERIEASI